MFLTNPAPICVLDEVDAPLDDHNVERFCDLLDEMTKSTDTRFVIITHNPITMARMNRLYGVTMAERGVSQLVSVDLRGRGALPRGGLSRFGLADSGRTSRGSFASHAELDAPDVLLAAGRAEHAGANLGQFAEHVRFDLDRGRNRAAGIGAPDHYRAHGEPPSIDCPRRHRMELLAYGTGKS